MLRRESYGRDVKSKGCQGKFRNEEPKMETRSLNAFG